MAVRISTPLSLQDAIHRLVLGGKLRITELSDRLGWSESSLYRAANPCDETNFPATRLIPAMIAQNDFGPLQHIACRCGFALFKIPKKSRMKASEIADLQKAQAEAAHALIRFMSGDASRDETIKAVDAAIGLLARGRRAADRGIKQGELEL